LYFISKYVLKGKVEIFILKQ